MQLADVDYALLKDSKVNVFLVAFFIGLDCGKVL